MYTIIGATGHTGGVIAEALLAQGRSVRAIGRDAERLQPLVAKGAKAWVGSVEDVDFLTEAFTNVTAIYTLLPSNMRAEDLRAYQNRIGAAIASAIREAAVRYVVNLSSIGAHLPEGTGPVLGLRDQEKRLNLIPGVNVLHLRPASFMENLLSLIPMLHRTGIFGGPLRPEVAAPMIAGRDVGRYATQRLLRLDFVGHQSQELLGQRDLSMREIAPILGRAVGRPDLQYTQFPAVEVEKAMVTVLGFSPDAARRMMEFEQVVNEGREVGGGPRAPQNTTATSIEEFAPIFAAAFRRFEVMEPSAAPSGHGEF
jgi:uncharacterized protein YbjT (DUF2867 family)